MREPAIWNMLTKDFYVTPLSYEDGSSQPTSQGRKITIKKGESIDHKGNRIVFESFNFPADAMSAMMGGGIFEIGANLTVESNGKTYNIEPKMNSTDGVRKYLSAKIEDLDLLVDMTNLDAGGSISLVLGSLSGGEAGVTEVKREVLSIEASIKPFINLVWMGVILMVIGFIISAVRRTKESH